METFYRDTLRTQRFETLITSLFGSIRVSNHILEAEEAELWISLIA